MNGVKGLNGLGKTGADLHGLHGVHVVPIVNNFAVATAIILNPITVGVIAKAKILPVRIALEACVNVSVLFKYLTI